MSDRLRPRLMVDRAGDGEIAWDSIPGIDFMGVACRFPHCDSRILHVPEECTSCAMFESLQQERMKLDVSNSGKMNRRWPCPADEARGRKNYEAWWGNRPKREG